MKNIKYVSVILFLLDITLFANAYSSVIIVEDAKACYRRVLAGKRVHDKVVLRVIPCERLEDCQRECSEERRFNCETFNYRLDPSNRGKGVCELTATPVMLLDLRKDFIEDRDYDFYELDRNSASDCSLSWPHWLENTDKYHGNRPGLTPFGQDNKDRYHGNKWEGHGWVSHSIQNQYGSNANGGEHRYDFNKHHGGGDRYGWKGWRDVNDGRHRPGTDRRWDRNFVPYEVGERKHHKTWGQYGGSYGYIGDYNAYHSSDNGHRKSYEYWGLNSNRHYSPNESFYPNRGVSDYDSYNKRFNYMDLGPPGQTCCGGNNSGKDSDYWATYGHKYGYGNPKGPSWGFGQGYGSQGFEHKYEDKWSHGSTQHRPYDCSLRSGSGFRMSRGVVRKSYTVSDIIECEKICFTEKQIPCNSYSFRYSRGPSENCFISNRLYRSLDLYNDVQPDKDFDTYAMNEDRNYCQHLEERPSNGHRYPGNEMESDCFWRVRSGKRLSGGAIKNALVANGIAQCEAECVKASSFTCRAFSFRYGPPVIGDSRENCHLTDWPQVSRTHDGLEESPPCEIYERGSYGRGCEPNPFMSDSPNALGPSREPKKDELCFLQYDTSAKLLPEAVRVGTRLPTEHACKLNCIRLRQASRNSRSIPSDPIPFNCMSFSYTSDPHLPPHKDNCLMTDIQLRDLQPGLDYIHSETHWLFAFNTFDAACSKGENYHNDNKYGPSSTSHLIPSYPPSSSGGYPPSPSSYPPSSGGYPPSSGGYPPSSGGYPPSSGSYPPSSVNYPPSSGSLPPDRYYPSGPSRPIGPGGPTGPSGYGGSGVPGAIGRPSGRPSRPDRPSGPGDYAGLLGRPGGSGWDKKQDGYDSLGGDTWAIFTVSGWPCRRGTRCRPNTLAGYWSCELEGGEVGSWDYCCHPDHRCGHSKGFNYPWCYVGESRDQWRPCSDRYYPYSHGQQSGLDRPGRPGYLPDYDRNDIPGHHHHGGRPHNNYDNRQYWDDLYKNGPSSYYDEYGNPRPGYVRVPTIEKNHIRYHHNYGPERPLTPHWIPVAAPERPGGPGPAFLDPPKPGGFGPGRYWPVSYLHKEGPPNSTYYKFDAERNKNDIPNKDDRNRFPNGSNNRRKDDLPGRFDTSQNTNDDNRNSGTQVPSIDTPTDNPRNGRDEEKNTTDANISNKLILLSANNNDPRDKHKRVVQILETPPHRAANKLDDKLEKFSGESVEVFTVDEPLKGKVSEKDVKANLERLLNEEKQIEEIGKSFKRRDEKAKIVANKETQRKNFNDQFQQIFIPVDLQTKPVKVENYDNTNSRRGRAYDIKTKNRNHDVSEKLIMPNDKNRLNSTSSREGFAGENGANIDQGALQKNGSVTQKYSVKSSTSKKITPFHEDRSVPHNASAQAVLNGTRSIKPNRQNDTKTTKAIASTSWRRIGDPNGPIFSPHLEKPKENNDSKKNISNKEEKSVMNNGQIFYEVVPLEFNTKKQMAHIEKVELENYGVNIKVNEENNSRIRSIDSKIKFVPAEPEGPGFKMTLRSELDMNKPNTSFKTTNVDTIDLTADDRNQFGTRTGIVKRVEMPRRNSTRLVKRGRRNFRSSYDPSVVRRRLLERQRTLSAESHSLES